MSDKLFDKLVDTVNQYSYDPIYCSDQILCLIEDIDKTSFQQTLLMQLLADAIKLPLKEWPGNCFGLANQIVNLNLFQGKARYGHYLGPVDFKSIFYKSSIAGFVQHGWIELPNKKKCRSY